MPNPQRPVEQQAAWKARLEALVAEGYGPPGVRTAKGSAFQKLADETGVNHGSIHNWLKAQQARERAGKTNFMPDWARFTPAPPREAGSAAPLASVRAGGVRRWLLTGAQDDTAVHAPFWNNLLAYAAWLGAEVRVGGFTYNKSLFEDHASRTAVFASEVQPFLAHERLDLGGILFCAEMNTLPTAVKPLSGLETFTRGRWGVFPHAKIQLVSVPAVHGARAAQLMTTGACTVANYVQKKAGIKAEFHHVAGATLVEIDGEGRIFCRQISATDDGAFQDLDVRVARGKVTVGHRIEAITWGDVHRDQIDPQVALTAWGYDIEADQTATDQTMLDALRPRAQFFHDLLDFRRRNHHRRGDHAHAYRMAMQGKERVDEENRDCARFLRATARDWCESVVIASNHNDALARWLRETDPRSDPINARFWCQATDAMLEAVERDDRAFDIVRWALSRHDGRGLDDIVFLPRNTSYMICQASGGIECSLHGDQGPNGARGTISSLVRVAVRMNIGHSHSPGIQDGVYQAGLCGLMDQGYNEGPSSWAHTQILTYPSGKRTLVTMIDGRWRA